ncbi:MAG: phage minor head protein, partial [Pseudomonadota bacterium]
MQITQREAGNTHYIWHTQADELVRNSHAPNHGQVFAWDNPPPTGHPGEDYNCRCTPIPFSPPALGIDDPPIEPSFIIEKLIIGGIIAKVANKAATAIGAAVAKIKKKKNPKEISVNDLNKLEQENLKRFNKKLPKNAKETKITRLPNSNTVFEADVPAR